jgi:hypothetical protein
MPMNKANTGIVTQINVFTVPEGGQQALINLLSESAKFASVTPGWVSASIHRSFDGTRVINYAQSETQEAAQRVIFFEERVILSAIKRSAKRVPVYTRWYSLSRNRGVRALVRFYGSSQPLKLRYASITNIYGNVLRNLSSETLIAVVVK